MKWCLVIFIYLSKYLFLLDIHVIHVYFEMLINEKKIIKCSYVSVMSVRLLLWLSYDSSHSYSVYNTKEP